MGDFKRLDVWRRSQKLVATVYRLTADFPAVERYGLSSQMRRAAVSISANVAEGCGRQGDVELRRFVRISLGSLSELECELLLADDLHYLETDACQRISTEIRLIRRMLQRLHEASRGAFHTQNTPVDVITSTSPLRRRLFDPQSRAVWSSSRRGTLWQCLHLA